VEAVPRGGVLSAPWSLERVVASAGAFHGRDLPAGPTVWSVEVPSAAAVLGSRQDAALLEASECARQGLEVARRRSGGGLVLLRPGEHVWVDVVIGRDDPRWTDDVSSSSWWLGDAWCRAVASLGVVGASVHRGRLESDEWGRQVCFAAVGPGEVVDATGAKVVGISQRRAGGTARFQCTAFRRWSGSDHAALLADPPEGGIDGRVRCVEGSPEDIVDAFLSALGAR
jgi:lipoate-protein ligase A